MFRWYPIQNQGVTWTWEEHTLTHLHLHFIHITLQNTLQKTLHRINKIITICKFLVNPATSVAGKRLFSAAWQLKTWFRSTMMQARFSNLSRGSMPPHPRPYLSGFERIRFKHQKRHVTLNPLLFTMLGTRRHNMAAVLLNMDIDHPRWQISNWSKACMFAFAYENLVVNLLSFSLVVAWLVYTDLLHLRRLPHCLHILYWAFASLVHSATAFVGICALSRCSAEFFFHLSLAPFVM